MHRPLYLGIALLTSLSCSWVYANGGTDNNRVPFDFEDGLIWVDVKVDAQDQPLHFVLDSGASVTVVDLDAVQTLNVTYGKAITVRGVQGHARARRLKNFSAHLDGQALPKSPLVLDLGDISQHCHQRIDGLIGADFLSSRTLQLDYQSKTLCFNPVREKPDDQKIVIKLKRLNDTWCIPAQINGNARHWVRIDTGYDGTLAWFSRAALREHSGSAATLALERASAETVESTVKIGQLSVQDVQTSLLPNALFPGESGLIGNAFLSDYRVTFDFRRNRMILEHYE